MGYRSHRKRRLQPVTVGEALSRFSAVVASSMLAPLSVPPPPLNCKPFQAPAVEVPSFGRKFTSWLDVPVTFDAILKTLHRLESRINRSE